MEIISLPSGDRPSERPGVYRVEFFRAEHGEVDVWRVSGATDLVEVLDWAHSESHGRQLAVSLEVDSPDGTFLVPIFSEALAHSYG